MTSEDGASDLVGALMLADAILLERYATRGDPDAFAEIVQRHTGMVFGVCRRLCGNAADADEVVQDCFLQLAKHAGRISSSLPAWLPTVAMHAASRANRRRGARRQEPLDAESVVMDPADTGAWQDLIPHIDAALAQLPIEQREAVMLRYLENRSQADIALLLHISQPTVSRRLEEGIAALRRRLGPQACFALPMLVVVPPPSLLASVGKMGLAGIGAPASGGAAVSAGGSFAASISGMPLLDR